MKLIPDHLYRAYLIKRLNQQPEAKPLLAYLQTPSYSYQQAWQQAEYLVLDLETSGTDPETADILSFGWVVIKNEHIQLSSARHYLVQARRLLREQNVAIHHITDDQAAQGAPLKTVLTEFLQVLAGKLLVAHYAPTELGFIKQACRQCFGAKPPLPAIDTLQLARRNPSTARLPLRLATLRNHYQLPRYAMHHALADALATAELFLAQVAAMEGERGILIKDLMTHS